MFQVEGYINQVSYAVRVGVDPDVDPGRMERAGIVLGTGRAIDVLRQNIGRQILLTPTGPSVLGSIMDPAGVLAVLLTQTEVTDVTGDDVPELIPAAQPGIVY